MCAGYRLYYDSGGYKRQRQWNWMANLLSITNDNYLVVTARPVIRLPIETIETITQLR